MVSDRGALFSWGYSHQGRLGLGKTPNQRVPVKNPHVADVQFRLVACGEAHSGAIDVADQAHSWTGCRSILLFVDQGYQFGYV